MSELSTLLGEGIVGVYSQFEVTEIFVDRGQELLPENVFTILVAEDDSAEQITTPIYLGGRIKVRALDGWTFGIKRYTRSIPCIIAELAKLEQGGIWEASGKQLQFGKLHKVPTQFVPPDSTTFAAWNRVLRSNFWNGSHVFEWSDPEKRSFDAIFASPPLLQELAGMVSASIPIDLAGFSDRLGNLVLQLPVTALISKFEPHRNGDCNIKIAWHPKVPPRALSAMCYLDFDGAVGGFVAGTVQEPATLLPAPGSRGLHRGFLWDEQHHVLLASSGPTGFIELIAFNIATADVEPRTFAYTGLDGQPHDNKVGLSNSMGPTFVGNPHSDETGGRTRKRLYREQEETLKKERIFKQYRPAENGSANERKQALDDLKYLINRHGQIGAWLWDPYLSANDLLETLFWSVHSGADLRGLTAAKEIPECGQGAGSEEVASGKQGFVERQRAMLSGVQGNLRGLRLEFRVRRGQFGWGFHDRFLILPQRDDAALVWSLGTSVNSLGTEHHIFQRADDGELVKGAFEELWNLLVEPEHLIWKRP